MSGIPQNTLIARLGEALHGRTATDTPTWEEWACQIAMPVLREARAALVQQQKEIAKIDRLRARLREAEARVIEQTDKLLRALSDIALLQNQIEVTDEALARLEQALERIAAHDGNRHLPDEEGYLTISQDTPQEDRASGAPGWRGDKVSFLPVRYDPKRCHADVPMKVSMLRYRQCRRTLPATGGYGPDGQFCYQHGAKIEKEMERRAGEGRP